MRTYRLRVCATCHKSFLAGNRYNDLNCPTCARHLRHVDATGTCLYCHNHFNKIMKNQKFCSEACRSKYNYAPNKIVFKKRCANIECQNEFLGNKTQRYCCEQCYRICRIDKELRRPKGPEDYISTEPIEV